MSNVNDDKIRRLLSGTRLEAGENLKFRIMQQIETEQALSRSRMIKKEARISKEIKSLLSIFGVMYTLIILVTVGAYFYIGTSFVTSIEFWLVVVAVTSISTVFALISHFDAKLRQSLKNKLN